MTQNMMKTKYPLIHSMLALIGAAYTQAATISQTDPLAGGISYRWTVTANASDSGEFSRHFGAWSWEDQTLGADTGWTHESEWVALTLSEAATFSMTLERDANVAYAGSGNVGGFAAVDNMFPSFTLWQGWDNDDGNLHTYYNKGAVSWAEDISYLDHYSNSTLTSITRSYNLAAGNYTFAIGSNASAVSLPPRQGYKFSFTTTPEPSRALLLLLGAGGMILRRRRA
jgi:hypothetical protein